MVWKLGISICFIMLIKINSILQTLLRFKVGSARPFLYINYILIKKTKNLSLILNIENRNRLKDYLDDLVVVICFF